MYLCVRWPRAPRYLGLRIGQRWYPCPAGCGIRLVILETAGIGKVVRSRGLVRSFPLRHDARDRCAGKLEKIDMLDLLTLSR